MNYSQPVSFHEYLVDLTRRGWVRHCVSFAFLGIAAALTWTLFKVVTLKPANIAVQTMSIARPMDARALAEHIADSHLFGQDTSQASTTAAVPAANIQVEGLLYSDDKDSALAILNVDGKSGMFKTGDTLPDGEILSAIGMAAIQVTNGGVPRVIELKRESGHFAPGILLAGAEGLMPQDSFPGAASTLKAPVPMQHLQVVDTGVSGNPIAKMKALRARLIKH